MWYSALCEFPVLAIAAIGFYISLRFLRFPDLTVDASFMLGMSAVGMMLRGGSSNELPGFVVAPILGAIAGAVTGFLYTSKHLTINKFLSGMLVAFAAYSVCFRMCGRADLSLFEYRHNIILYRIFAPLPLYAEPLGLLVLVALAWVVAHRLMNTPFGLALRTAGHQPDVLEVSGINSKLYIVLGLAFSNGIIACAGALDAVSNRNVSLRNFGMVVNVLAACLIGDFLRRVVSELVGFSRKSQTPSTTAILFSPLVGALAYCLIKSLVIRILSGQLTITITTDLQFVVALSIVLSILAAKRLRSPAESRGEEGM